MHGIIRLRIRAIVSAAIVIVMEMVASSSLVAQTTLTAGDVKVVGFNYDAPDGFVIVLMKDVAANTVIKVTDGSFLGTGSATLTDNFNGTEGFVSFRFDGAATAGTVVRLVDAGSSVSTVTTSSNYTGGITSNNSLGGLAATGDQLFVYQGTGFGNTLSTDYNVAALANPTTFGGTVLFGLNNRSAWLTSGSATSGTSYLPSELSGFGSNVDFVTSTDNRQYTAARTGLTSSAFGAAIVSTTNWAGNNGPTNLTLSTTEFTFATSANLYFDANGSTAGTGGTGTWDGTTADRFTNSANDTFLRWVDSLTGSNHTAVFGGTAGTVTVSGTVSPTNLQFATDGYQLNGGTIAFFGSASSITTDSGVSASISSVLSGSGTLTKAGTGSLTLSGSNSYTGTVAITQGELQFGAANTLANTVSLTLNGGTLSTGAVTGFSQTLAGLTFASSTDLSLGSGSHTLTFGTLTDSSSSGDVLSIFGWSSSEGNIVFTGIGSAATANANFATVLSRVQFDGKGLGEAHFVTSGANVELVPTPEPVTVLALGAAGLGFVRIVRRRCNQ